MCASATTRRLQPSAPEEPPPFRVVVTPYRALSVPQYLALAGLSLTLAMTIQIPLARAGAWPCLLFGFGEIGLLLGAIWLHRRSQDRTETITLTGGSLQVVRCVRGRVLDSRRLPVFGSHVVWVDDPDYGCQVIAIQSRGRRIEIARDLSPDERPSLADALTAALGEAGGSPRLHVETRRSLNQHLDR
ncbi:DUF2244 domain-containing protein [Methylobacterium fujisawaense]|uniref:DUF2244 domain-containing protein n=1 Tax=Methylobacterium fujisawaense TaxID=107400 RepID=UPI0037032ACB